jgi:hypothetical protein
MVMIEFGIVYGILKTRIMTAGINKVASRYQKNTYRRIHPTDMIYFAGPARTDGNEHKGKRKQIDISPRLAGRRKRFWPALRNKRPKPVINMRSFKHRFSSFQRASPAPRGHMVHVGLSGSGRAQAFVFAVLSIDAADMNPEDFSKRLQENIDAGNAKEIRPYKLAMSCGNEQSERRITSIREGPFG